MIKIDVEFGDEIKLEVSEEGRLEITLSDINDNSKTSWLTCNQMEALITEMKILRAQNLIKYSDEFKKQN